MVFVVVADGPFQGVLVGKVLVVPVEVVVEADDIPPPLSPLPPTTREEREDEVQTPNPAATATSRRPAGWGIPRSKRRRRPSAAGGVRRGIRRTDDDGRVWAPYWWPRWICFPISFSLSLSLCLSLCAILSLELENGSLSLCCCVCLVRKTNHWTVEFGFRSSPHHSEPKMRRGSRCSLVVDPKPNDQ